MIYRGVCGGMVGMLLRSQLFHRCNCFNLSFLELHQVDVLPEDMSDHKGSGKYLPSAVGAKSAATVRK